MEPGTLAGNAGAASSADPSVPRVSRFHFLPRRSEALLADSKMGQAGARNWNAAAFLLGLPLGACGVFYLVSDQLLVSVCPRFYLRLKDVGAVPEGRECKDTPTHGDHAHIWRSRPHWEDTPVM